MTGKFKIYLAAPAKTLSGAKTLFCGKIQKAAPQNGTAFKKSYT